MRQIRRETIPTFRKSNHPLPAVLSEKQMPITSSQLLEKQISGRVPFSTTTEPYRENDTHGAVRSSIALCSWGASVISNGYVPGDSLRVGRSSYEPVAAG